MKKLMLIILIFFFGILLLADTSTMNIMIWEETSVEDFSDNALENLIVTDSHGGAVRLPHIMQKQMVDHQDDSLHRFVAKDNSGNFIRTWITDRKLYAQKFAADSSALSEILQVNPDSLGIDSGNPIRCAILDDGSFCVVWIGDNSNMYGQVFSTQNIKAGPCFRINEKMNVSTRKPVVWANNTDGLFWIIFSVKDSDDWTDYKFYVQKRDTTGEKAADDFRLNKNTVNQSVMYPAVCSDHNGNLLFAWAGHDDSHVLLDVFVRRYDPEGQPLSSPVRVNSNEEVYAYCNPDLDCDEDGNILVVWRDGRESIPYQSTYPRADIYGQLFDSTFKRLDGNFRINEPINQNDAYAGDPDVQYNNGSFQVSWKYFIRTNYNINVNRWDITPVLHGNMISSIYDAGPGGAKFHNILWDEVLQDSTEISFKLRTANDAQKIVDAQWFGPTNTNDYYENKEGQIVNTIHTDDRYIQYKTLFKSDKPGFSPQLRSISLSYVPNDSIPPSVPTNLQATLQHSQITLKWMAPPDKDVASYIIYRGPKSGWYHPEYSTQISAQYTEFVDTSAVSGENYFYVVSAVDSSRNESEYSNEVSSSPASINIYVSPQGSPAGDGTIQNPFSSIMDAIKIAEYGDKVILLPGSYNEVVIMKEGISLIGSGAAVTELSASGADYIIQAADDVTISGLTIYSTGSIPILCKAVSPVITENVILCTAGSPQGIRCLEYGVYTITKNYIKGFGIAIWLYDFAEAKIMNNIIEAKSQGISSGVYAKFEVINNTIIVDEVDGIKARIFSGVLKNNIIVGNKEKTTGISDHYAGLTIKYNDVWNHKINYEYTTSGEGDISEDPLFVNPGLQNYQLQENSPCRDAGDLHEKYNDIDGSRNDMGVFGGPDPIDPALMSRLVKSVQLSRISGFPGDTVKAFVSLDDAAGIAAADLEISFNAQLLSFISAQKTPTTDGFNLKTEIILEGDVHFLLESDEAVESGTDSILQINFKVNAQSQPGDATQITFKKIILLDEASGEILVQSITDGVFVVNYGNDNGRYVFVDLNNEGDEDGSRQHPFRTIQNAIDHAAVGDTILVAAGRYCESIELKEATYLRGTGATVTKIAPDFKTKPYGVLFKNIKEGELSGFTIIGPDEGGFFNPLLQIDNSSPLIRGNCFKSGPHHNNVEVSYNSQLIIEGNAFDHTDLRIDESNAIIRDNSIIPDIFEGIVCSNSNPVIYRNQISGDGSVEGTIRLDHCKNALVQNNMLYCKNEIGAFSIYVIGSESVRITNNVVSKGMMGIMIDESTNIEIYNNVIYKCLHGLHEIESSLIAYNNIISDNLEFGFKVKPGTDMDYNNCWNSGNNYSNCSPGPNDLSADALFKNSEKLDFRLSGISPCIDAGHPGSEFIDVDGSRNDMGVYGGPYADLKWNMGLGCRLKADSLDAAPNDTIHITIHGQSIKNSAQIAINLSYDPQVLSFIDARPTDLTQSLALTTVNSMAGILDLNLDGVNGLVEDEGNLLILSFAVMPTNKKTATIHFESASIKDAASKSRLISQFTDGQIKLTATGINEKKDGAPRVFALYQNYPNPFNSMTKIKFQVAHSEKVRIIIYDILGREVRTLVDDFKHAGPHSIIWDGRNNQKTLVASGIYFYRMEAGSFIKTKKLLFIK